MVNFLARAMVKSTVESIFRIFGFSLSLSLGRWANLVKLWAVRDFQGPLRRIHLISIAKLGYQNKYRKSQFFFSFGDLADMSLGEWAHFVAFAGASGYTGYALYQVRVGIFARNFNR